MSPCRVGIVAGEVSGDILGAGLMSELKSRYPNIEFVGVGGTQMSKQGLIQLYAMDRLSVMGLIEPLKRLPELLRMRRKLAKYFTDANIDLFVGIDSPDFNLGLAKRLKRRGIKTLHYVSPSVWAWRQGRIKSIRESVDMMLTLLPFEAEFYKKHDIPVKFVGHPLASEIDGQGSKIDSRHRLGLEESVTTIALLPGSRTGEIKHLVPVYLRMIDLFDALNRPIQFVFAAVNPHKAEQIKALIGDRGNKIIVARTLQVMAASDLVVAASGTTTLEAMLVNRPLIVAYRTEWLSYKIISSMLKVPYVSLPNLIAGKEVVSEFLQGEANAENLMAAALTMLDDAEQRQIQERIFSELSVRLKLPSNRLAGDAAAAVLNDV